MRLRLITLTRCMPWRRQDEAALENLVLERGLPSVEFIWCAHAPQLKFTVRCPVHACRKLRTLRLLRS